MEIDKQEDENFVYVNLDKFNTNNFPIDAKLSFNKIDQILYNPEDWLIYIDQFSIPLYAIPLFQFKENKYKITLEWNGTSVQKPLIYS